MLQKKKSKSTKIHSQYHLRPNSSCISWSRLVQACCVHILYITTYLVITNTVFNQSYVCCSSPCSSHQACLHLWLFSQSSWWLVLTDDRLSRASEYTNNFPSTLSLTFLFLCTQLDWHVKCMNAVLLKKNSSPISISAKRIQRTCFKWLFMSRETQRRWKISVLLCQERRKSGVLEFKFSFWPLYLMV